MKRRLTSSHPFTPHHTFAIFWFKLTKPKIAYFSVKTCEDLWRHEIGLHADKPLYNNALSCLCEEWGLFCNFLFFMSLQTYCLHPASLWFSARNPMHCALHSYSFQRFQTVRKNLKKFYPFLDYMQNTHYVSIWFWLNITTYTCDFKWKSKVHTRVLISCE